MRRFSDLTLFEFIAGLSILVVILAFIGFVFVRTKTQADRAPSLPDGLDFQQKVDVATSQPVEVGKQLSHDFCEGEGSVALTHSPMDDDDFIYILPYGLMAGGHVTPIDHGYFEPTDRSLGRDAYPVYAMADGTVVDIQNRYEELDSQVLRNEYRLVFAHTCTFFTYYDLVTSLAPDLQAAYDKAQSNHYAVLDYPVNAGDLIGYIGGQTLDYAVWNTAQDPLGFVILNHYNGEAWKIYTADPYEFLSADLNELFTQKALRDDPPIAGKIDYDIDGRLMGNWFLDGTEGYSGAEGNESGEYWSGHLSLAPDYLDPNRFIFSIGDFFGEAKQFTVKGNAPDPASVGPESGKITYKLVNFSYWTPQGLPWDGNSLVKGLTVKEGFENLGCVLLEMTSARSLRLELFAQPSCSNINDFTAASRIYSR